MTKTVLVTGGAGFIGANFVHTALKRGFRVIVLDLLTYAGNPGNLEGTGRYEHYSFIQGSINDLDLVKRLLAEFRPHWLVNFAAESHVDRSIDHPGSFVETNIVGVFQLLQAVRETLPCLPGAFRFLQVSTDEVYGSIETGCFTETSGYDPNSPYAASKASADHLVRACQRTYGLPLLITNCSNNYGPYQHPEKFLPVVITNALQGKSIPIYGDGRQVRDWLFVEDHCEALLTVLERGEIGQSYNIGGENEAANRDVATAICRILDRIQGMGAGHHEQFLRHVSDRPAHDRRYAVEIGKIRRELGWEPKTGFATGLERTVRWYADNGQWWRNSINRAPEAG